MIVISTLLVSLVSVALSNTFCASCPASGSQCGTSVSTSLTCAADNTCCSSAAGGCAISCTDCTTLDLSGDASAVGAAIAVLGTDAAMAVTVSGTMAACGTTITGEGFRTFDCTGTNGFTNGDFTASPANEDTGLAVTCTGANCCDTAAFNVRFAASFLANTADAAYNVQFSTEWPLNNQFTIDCGAPGACESGDFVIKVEDCLGADPWVVPSITCSGADSCHGATFTFINGDPDCTLQIGSFICTGTDACRDVRVYTQASGPIVLGDADCTCGTGACTGAGSDPAGFCPSFVSTFSPTLAPSPTLSPTPCPTTATPTTAAPTTAAPTTAAPTTAAPTTAAPVTAAPTTSTVEPEGETIPPGDDDDDSDSDSDDDDELAELEQVLDELNAAHVAHAQAEDEEQTPIAEEEPKDEGLFGQDNSGTDTDTENGTNYEMVISLSNEALEHLWAIVITFVVFNGVCIWCYYNRFGGSKKRYGDSLPSTV